MIVALALAAAFSSGPSVPIEPPMAVRRMPGQIGGCPPAPLIATQGAGAQGARKMTELPPPQHILAVEKRVGGCAVNVLKQTDFAGNHVMVPAGPAGVRTAPVAKRGRR
ncbi:MAG TPA: hypothetical protein VF699_10105 [Caulobacteraceae bacterium]